MNNNTVSYWNSTCEKSVYPQLEKSIETTVLIVGGGITGITCAYCLAEKGLRPVVIEAGALCDGTTGNTTGKVTIQHDDIYSTLEKKYSLDAAKIYAKSQTSALDFVRNVVKKESIECQLAESTAYLYASSEGDAKKIEDEYMAALNIGIEAVMLKSPSFPNENFGMVGFKKQAVFHPVRYVTSLAKAAEAMGARIYCETKAFKVEDGEEIVVHCDNGIKIKTKHLVEATQYPIYDGPNLFFARLYPKRSYGIAVRTKRDWEDGSYINLSGPSRSIRTHKENGERILIVVGEGHTTGRSQEDTQIHYDNLIGFADSIAGVDKVLAKWSAQDYDTPDSIPYIGRISDKSNIYVGAGYKKWGLSTGTLAGIMISELIADGKCEYEDFYSRDRNDFLSSPGKTIYGVFSPVVELIKSKLEAVDSIKDLERGEGRVINFDGHKAGIYRDLDDSVIILDISCTHMTTELNFNNAEKTWDCPAHGGRFSTSGELLEGPPKHPLKIYFEGMFSDLVAE